MRAWRWGIVLVGAMVLTSCTVKVPEVQVGGGGSSLEEQVVGSYESIGSSYDVISSRAVGGVVTRKPPTPEVRAAYARQRERLPQLEALKRSGAVGEDNAGHVVLRDAARLPEGWTPESARELLRNENSDRDLIANWVAQSTMRLRLTPKAKVVRALAKMYQRQSPEGTWVQAEDGSWTRK